eukprot:CAMPEP_0170531624 /NCGR_PEP_ID=MMETSP0209-20121228/63688_1 /TAXON_ID=665100 ORGANISM="Litonotus pictus, Strain P1" /NCGR_SAMPLE_ID=MMETSP0209 /ASSEMBLY_ACC=CAM_ASM_000301 /LENGTH=51 /DNA_ID=CAMNT_0010826529 /DNA_START=226 /DNA_END=377 /DNA_ORIENTATION=+
MAIELSPSQPLGNSFLLSKNSGFLETSLGKSSGLIFPRSSGIPNAGTMNMT